jgi:hypothetical protein
LLRVGFIFAPVYRNGGLVENHDTRLPAESNHGRKSEYLIYIRP